MGVVFRPERRNRNTGTARAGYRKQSHFHIPSQGGNAFWQNIRESRSITLEVNGKAYHFLIEALKKGYHYSCTPEEVCKNLCVVPLEDMQGLDLIIFRQPKAKEVLFRNCWGRLIYEFSYNDGLRPAIIIEAVNTAREVRIRKSLDPFEMREVEHLRGEGHTVTDSGRFYCIRSTLEAARATQLYRTLYHEIGHYYDYIREIAHNHQDKEAFANRYAQRMQERLRELKGG